MKLSSISIFPSLLVATTIANRYQACLYKTNGETCTNEDGQQSRCSPLYSCRPLPTLCGADAKDLQSCGDGYTDFCFPFLGPELRCLNKLEIIANLKFDACNGKPDGTPCKAPYLETESTGAAALYEENGRCSGQVCLSSQTVACEGKAVGQGCEFEGALDFKTYRFSGNCEQKYSSKDYMPACKASSQTYLGPATPIKSHAGRQATSAPFTRAPVPTQATTTAPVTAAPEPTTLRPVTSAPPATTKPAATITPATTTPATTTPAATSTPATSTPTTTAATTEQVSGSRPGSSENELLEQETTSPVVPRPEILPTPTASSLRTPLPTLSSGASAAGATTVLATAAAAAVIAQL